MSDRIIDTNVAVIANGQNDEVVCACFEACVVFLAKTHERHRVIVDDVGEVLAEYMKALKVARPYGLGALFLIRVQQEQYNPRRVFRVELPKSADGAFVHMPAHQSLASFDQDDHKFAALSRKTGTPVSNATDSDWVVHREALEANGVKVEFLCGCDKTKWFR